MPLPLFPRLAFEPELLNEGTKTETVLKASAKYGRKPSEKYNDKPANLSSRQANFYRNLISITLALKKNRIPVDFTLSDGKRMYLDRGCIKIAEHAGFILPLVNDETGNVSEITLSWRTRTK